MTGRELGVETLPCPGCGAARPVEAQEDGGQAAAACAACFSPEQKPEVALQVNPIAPSREVGTPFLSKKKED